MALPKPRRHWLGTVCAAVALFLLWTPALDAASPGADRPKVAVVLGGGAARGISHIGFLQALEESGIPIDYVVGTSMGSIVGALYAAGYSPADLRQIVRNLDYSRLFSLRLPPRGGFLVTEPFAAFLDTLLGGRDFARLRLPFYAVITRLSDGQEVALHEGPVSRAVLASMTIPVLFPPVEIGGAHFVDGGMKNAVPANVARQVGADIVLAVDVKKELRDVDYGSLLHVFQLTMYFMIDGYVQQIAPLADVVVVPDVKYDSYMEYGRVDYFIAQGYAAARRALPEIKAVLARQAPDFPYHAIPPTPDHSVQELQALVELAYARAAQAPRPLTVAPLLRAAAGSEPRLAAGLNTRGGALGAWQAAYGYLWDFADAEAGHHALSLSAPWGTHGTLQVFLKRYPAHGLTRPGAAWSWSDPGGWQSGASLEGSFTGAGSLWEIFLGRDTPRTDRLAGYWRLSAEKPGPFTRLSARAGLTQTPVPEGWALWESALVFPELCAEAEARSAFPDQAGIPQREFWLRAGGALDVRLFGLIPFKVRFLAGQELGTGKRAWSLDFGQEVSLP